MWQRKDVNMNKFIIAVMLSVPILFLSGCSVSTVEYQTVAYDPGYSNDYVYSVGYYNNRPYWGNNYYYYNYGLGDYGYWGSYY